MAEESHQESIKSKDKTIHEKQEMIKKYILKEEEYQLEKDKCNK